MLVAARALRGYIGVAPARTASQNRCRRVVRLRTTSRPRTGPVQPARDETQRSEAPYQIGMGATVVQAATLMSPPPASAQLLPFNLTGYDFTDFVFVMSLALMFLLLAVPPLLGSKMQSKNTTLKGLPWQEATQREEKEAADNES